MAVQPFGADDEAAGAGRPDGAPVGPRRRPLRLLVLLAVAALSACAGGGSPDGAAAPAPESSLSTSTAQGGVAPAPGSGTPGGAPTPTSSPAPPGDGDPGDSETEGEPPAPPDLATFLADCERGVSQWRAAQVDYPSNLTIEVGGTASYVAAVDARATPASPSELIPGPSATGEAAAVRCEVAARLTTSGGALTIDETDWVLRRFTLTGFIRWSWTVTAVEGGDQDLELELQPALRTEDGTILVGNSTLDVSTFITRAHVDEDAIQAASSWMESHKGPLAVIAAALAAAALGVVRFGREFATEMRQTVAAWSGSRPDHGGASARGGTEEGEDADEPEDLGSPPP